MSIQISENNTGPKYVFKKENWAGRRTNKKKEKQTAENLTEGHKMIEQLTQAIQHSSLNISNQNKNSLTF